MTSIGSEKAETHAFDPYRQWLGIPKEDQPPHHYRLLGLAPFESDPDVIESAAERQMKHIGRIAKGVQLTLSQKLHDELTEARDCLLVARSKRIYDEQLKSRINPISVAAETCEMQTQNFTEPELSVQGEYEFEANPGTELIGARPRTGGHGTSIIQFAIGSIIGGMLIWGLYGWLGSPQVEIRRSDNDLTVTIVRTNQPPVSWKMW